MKCQNAISDFSKERSRELLLRFREKIATQSKLTAKRVFAETAQTPASRFWVSAERAANVIYCLEKGDRVLDNMLDEKREMFLEIYRRYLEMRKVYRDATVIELVGEIVNQPAPRHYLSAERVRSLVNQEKRRNRSSKQYSNNG